MHDFTERLNFSECVGLEDDLIAYLLGIIPYSLKCIRASQSNDRNGVDFWIIRKGELPPIAIDVKHREFDPIERFGSDDVCIETCSVYTGPPTPPWLDEHRKVIGWTLNPLKRTDLVVYSWPQSDGSRRFWIVYFPFLCRAALANWRLWAQLYGEKPVFNQGYLTLCIFPPRHVVEEAIRRIQGGVIVCRKPLKQP